MPDIGEDFLGEDCLGWWPFGGSQCKKLKGDPLEGLWCSGSLRNLLNCCLRDLEVRSGGIYFEAAGKRGQEHCPSLGRWELTMRPTRGRGKCKDLYFFLDQRWAVWERDMLKTLYIPQGGFLEERCDLQQGLGH